MAKEKNKKLALLLASTLVVSWGIINVNIPAMADAFSDVSLFWVENLATVSSLFIMIAVLISHQIAHRLGYKQTVLIGMGIVGVSGLIPLFITDFYIIFLSRALMGLGIGMFQSLLVSMNKYFFKGVERTKMFGYQSAFEGIGGVIFTLVSGQLVKMGWQGLFYLYLLVIPIFLIFMIFIPRIDTTVIESKNKREIKSPTVSVKVEFESLEMLKNFGYVLLVFVLSGMYMILAIKTSTLIISKGYGTATDSATVLFLMGVGAMLSGFAFGYVVERTGRMTLCLGYLTMALSMFMFGTASSIGLLSLGGLMAGFSFRTIIPYLLNHINSDTVANSHFISSLILVALNLGTFVSPYGALLIEKLLGEPTISGVFYTNGAILLCMTVVSAVIQLVFNRSKHKLDSILKRRKVI